MSTITKQWLQQKIADMEVVREDIPFGLDEDDSNTLAAMRIALASLEAEPVAWMWEIYGGGHMYAKIKPSSLDAAALYTTPPSPVSVPDAYIRDERGRMMLNGKPEPRIGYGGGWNAFRAAMLQGADGNSPVIPDDLIRRIAFSLVYLAADEKLRSDEDSLFALVRQGIDVVRRELAAPQQE